MNKYNFRGTAVYSCWHSDAGIWSLTLSLISDLFPQISPGQGYGTLNLIFFRYYVLEKWKLYLKMYLNVLELHVSERVATLPWHPSNSLASFLGIIQIRPRNYNIMHFGGHLWRHKGDTGKNTKSGSRRTFYNIFFILKL